VKAVSASGANYQGLVASGITNVTPGAQCTQIWRVPTVGQAGAPNFRTSGVLHLTVAANGNVTASIDHPTATCTS
jgi:hypothetical protein